MASPAASSPPGSPASPVPAALPAGSPPITFTRIDFAATALPEYDGSYAAVLDNVLTPGECAALLAAGEAAAGGHWAPALMNYGNGREKLNTGRRSCARILLDHAPLAGALFARVRPFLADVAALDPDDAADAVALRVCCPPKRFARKNARYELARCNERVRLLKYGAGDFFKPHTDGCFHWPLDKPTEYSMVTLHLYLNDAESTQTEKLLEGGATRFWPADREDMTRWHDVPAKTGRVLVFQQFGLRHSGEEVMAGTKLTLRTDMMFRKVLKGPEEKKAAKETAPEEAKE